jgi:hypothetical protein
MVVNCASSPLSGRAHGPNTFHRYEKERLNAWSRILPSNVNGWMAVALPQKEKEKKNMPKRRTTLTVLKKAACCTPFI